MEQMKLVDSFVGDLETTLGGTRVLKLSITEVWNATAPEEASGKSINEFFDEVYKCLTSWDCLMLSGCHSNVFV